MSQPPQITFTQRIQLAIENTLMTRLVPKGRVGGFFGMFFKIPLLFYKLHLTSLVPGNVLVIVTQGRKTGLERRTPVEFSRDAATGAFVVMSGWDGRTDWYRNARANPRVRVLLRDREIEAIAEPIPDEAVAQMLKEIVQVNPAATRMWERWSDARMDGSDASYLSVAPHFPSLYLRPRNKGD